MTVITPLLDLRQFPALTPQSVEILQQTGSNRAPAKECQIQAMNDLEAAVYWLNEYKDSPSTYRSYKKEILRLLLWCSLNADRPLSSLTRDDFENYSNFLSDPKPHTLWCGPKSRNKSSWKPFVRGLSPSARSTSLSIIDSLMQYLVQAGYLSKNPLKLIRKKSTFSQDTSRKIKSLERKLELDEIHALLQSIEELPEDTSKSTFYKYRLRF